MASDRSKPLSEITFYCRPCYRTFKAAPARVEDAPDLDHHPYIYHGECPHCGSECDQVGWERGLLKAWANSTGPRTEEGKAASAANLEGHPTKEEALRTRFNAMKHGLAARTATYFPAKPDGYAFCATCEVDRVFCASQPACVKKTELFMLHHAAFDQRNPKHLMGIYSDLQASIFALVQQIIQTIVIDGVKIERLVWKRDADDVPQVVEYFDEQGNRRLLRDDVQAHPLLKQLGELLTRTGLSLSDMGMTQKVIETEDQEVGRLAHEKESQEGVNAFQQRTVQLLESMAEKVMRANKQTDTDPILIEYQQENGK